MAQGRSEMRALLDAHGIRPRRRLGQNFLTDPNLVVKIVRTAAVGPGMHVVEVGAGTGTLTRELAASGADVVAYEIDRRLVPLLREVLAGYNVELRSEDVTKVDLAEALGKGPWTMVANLPYNVGTPLILEVLQHAPEVERLVVMVQREVAERLTAAPGDKTYGIPSVVTSLYSDAAIAFSVPPDVFYPAPEVDSSVVEMARKEAPAAADAAIELAAVCFRQRRKMLRRSLEQTFSDPEVVLAAAGLDPTARPEVLSPGDFLRLAEAAL